MKYNESVVRVFGECAQAVGDGGTRLLGDVYGCGLHLRYAVLEEPFGYGDALSRVECREVLVYLP